MQSRFSTLATLVLPLTLGLSFHTSSAQTPSEADAPPTLKQFGSSLKRLKWDPEKKAVTEIAERGPSRTSSSAEDVVRIDIDLVVWDAIVLDRDGNIVMGLRKDDFIVLEDEKTQQVEHFSAGDDLNIERSIILIIDYSSSQRPFIRNSIEAAKTLVDQLRPKDQMAIVTDDVELLVDYTRDKAALKYALDDLRQRATLQDRFGRSDQFSALMATARELFSREDYRRIIIFQTDGDELELLQPPDLYRYYFIPRPGANASKKEKRMAEMVLANSIDAGKPIVKEFSLNDVYRAAEKSRATLYAVIPGVRLFGLSAAEQKEGTRRFGDYWLAIQQPPSKNPKKYSAHFEEHFLRSAPIWMERQAAVDGAAKVTGGFTSFLEYPVQAAEIYQRILSDMNSRYAIGYYPSNKLRDGKRRSVTIQVRNHPEYRIEGRRSYLAPGPE